jgi:Uma2 family endonuclease
MTTIVPQKMTYGEFLNFDDGTDYLYELEDGNLCLVPFESDNNRNIVSFLYAYFLSSGISYSQISTKTGIVVPSELVNVRVPDLVIFSLELRSILKQLKQSLILMDMPAPSLVVEVVSPNQSKRDYEDKRQEYGTRGIPEYWIVDPLLTKVTVLQLIDREYQDQVYTGNQPIVSLLLGKTTLTAQAILTGGET